VGAEYPCHKFGIARYGQIGNEQEKGTADSERRGHDEAVAEGRYCLVLGEASHEFDKFVEHLLFRHEKSSLS